MATSASSLQIDDLRSAKGKPGLLYPHAHWWFLLALSTTWVGFAQSYFMRLHKVTIFHHIHGATAGLWMTLMIVQPVLYQRGKLALHRKLGRWGVYGLVPLLVVGGAVMLHMMFKNRMEYPPGAPFMLGIADLYTLFLFPACVVLSIYYGRDLQLHARYMACTVLLLVPPALGRALFYVPGITTMTRMVNVTYPLVMLVLVILLWDDKRKGGIRTPYALTLLAFVVMLVSMNLANHWAWWVRFGEWYGGL